METGNAEKIAVSQSLYVQGSREKLSLKAIPLPRCSSAQTFLLGASPSSPLSGCFCCACLGHIENTQMVNLSYFFFYLCERQRHSYGFGAKDRNSYLPRAISFPKFWQWLRWARLKSEARNLIFRLGGRDSRTGVLTY